MSNIRQTVCSAGYRELKKLKTLTLCGHLQPSKPRLYCLFLSMCYSEFFPSACPFLILSFPTIIHLSILITAILVFCSRPQSTAKQFTPTIEHHQSYILSSIIFYCFDKQLIKLHLKHFPNSITQIEL
jgi:hypothetical protein